MSEGGTSTLNVEKAIKKAEEKLNYNINYIPKLLQVDFSYC